MRVVRRGQAQIEFERDARELRVITDHRGAAESRREFTEMKTEKENQLSFLKQRRNGASALQSEIPGFGDEGFSAEAIVRLLAGPLESRLFVEAPGGFAAGAERM
jgi:hypothetical protein